MKINILEADMEHSEENGYLGRVVFQAENHKADYELTLQSDKGKEWNYSLNFRKDPGSEEEITAVEERIENDDEFFDRLVDAAKSRLSGA